jgi:hypothetical protein
VSKLFVTRDSWNFYNLKWLDDYMVGHKGFIAGGCFKNIFNGEPVKDIDVFFESEIDFLEAEKRFKDSRDNGWYLYYQNNKVVAFKNKEHPKVTIELIKTTYGTPEEVINRFDFSITKFAYYRETEKDDESGNETTLYKVIHHELFFEHLHLKRLVVEPDLLFPVSTFERMLRYAKYGYFPCRETKRRIIQNIRTNVINGDDLSLSLYDGMD